MNCEQVPVEAASPYPEIRVVGVNPRYAELLLQDISDAKGEMTALYQYIYQDWCFRHQFQELACLLRRIAAVEMRHLDILGRLNLLLGGNPILRTQAANPQTAWNGNMIYYGRNIKPLLADNVSLERAAADAYLAQAEVIQDPFVAAMLKRLALDEQIHHHLFTSYLSQL